MMRAPWSAILASIAVVLPAQAQRVAHVSIGATVSGVRSTARGSAGRQVSSGHVVGGTLSLRAGPLVLSGEYGEGSLKMSGGAGTSDPFIEGAAAATVQLSHWLAVGATVSARRMVVTDPERWVAYGAIARAEVPIIGRQVVGIAQFRQGLGGKVNLFADKIRAQDGLVGLRFAPARGPFWVELDTRIERYSAGGETRTLEQYGISLGLRGL